MICRACLRRSLTASRTIAPRQFTTSTVLRWPAAAEPTLSTPLSSSPGDDAPQATATTGAPKEKRSVCPAGTVLTGLNYFKGRQDPVALEDDEYPEWLWRCLDVKKDASAAADDGAGDEFCTWPLPRRLAHASTSLHRQEMPSPTDARLSS